MMITFILLWTPWLIGLVFWIYKIAKSLLDWMEMVLQPVIVEQINTGPRRRYHWMPHVVTQVSPIYGGLLAWLLIGALLGYYTLQRH